jgi:hypothetical protein
MKKIILFIILLSIPALGQVKKNVFNTQQRDTIKTLIADSAAILRGEIADLGTDSVGVKGLIADTANALRAEWQGDISDSLANFTSGLDTATVDSLARAAISDSLGNYVDKSTTQTITGQKNFIGKINIPDSNKTIMTITNPNASAYGDYHLQVRNFNVNLIT